MSLWKELQYGRICKVSFTDESSVGKQWCVDPFVFPLFLHVFSSDVPLMIPHWRTEPSQLPHSPYSHTGESSSGRAVSKHQSLPGAAQAVDTSLSSVPASSAVIHLSACVCPRPSSLVVFQCFCLLLNQ